MLCVSLLFFSSLLCAEEIDYRYDAGNRLVQTQYQGITTEDYTYDLAGNRLSRTVTDSGSPVNNTPNAPGNPVPASGTQGVLSGVRLSWTGLDPDTNDILLYQVRFGSSSPPPVVHVQHETSAPVKHGLDSFTTYYWQVVVNDNRNGVSSGPIWQFTTGNNPPFEPELSQPADLSKTDFLDVAFVWQSRGDENPNDTVSFDLYCNKPSTDAF